MGAHLVPAEYKQDRAEDIRLVCEEMMPAVRATPKDHPILRLAYRLVRERMEPRSIPTMTALQVSCFILSPEPR